MPEEPEDLSRKQRMHTLACAAGREIAALWSGTGLDPAFENLRGPESGLATVRGRISGDGAPFNVGDVTVTRATIRLADGPIGHGWRLGRDRAAAQLSAVIDALCADVETAARIDNAVIEPLARKQRESENRRSAEAAATKVDFFTLVRGED